MSLLLFTLCLSQQPPPPKINTNSPQYWVEKAIVAHGGKAKLDAMRESTWKGKALLYQKNDPQPSSFHYEWSQVSAEEYKAIAKFVAPNGLLPITTVLKKDEAWRQFGEESESADIVDQKKTEERDIAHAWYLQRITPLLDAEYKLEHLGPTRRDERMVIGVKAERAGYTPVRLYFDKATFVLLCLEYGVQDEEKSGRLLLRWMFANFREHQGAKFSSYITITKNSADYFQFKVEEVKAGCDKEIFIKPMPKKRDRGKDKDNDKDPPDKD